VTIGDFSKETWNAGAAPGISAVRLQTREDKLYEIDQLLATLGIDDSVSPAADTAALTVLVNWFAHMLKTLSGAATWRTDPTKSLEDLKNALIDPGSAEQGDIFYQGAAALARLAHGTAGQVLLSGGHAANPTWGSVLGPILFGDGSDGDVTISGDTTLARDMFYNNLTVNNGVTLSTGGYRIYVAGTLTNNGTIQNNGGIGGNGTASVGAVGAGATATNLGGGSNGGAGGKSFAGGTAGTNLSNACGNGGGAGGNGSAVNTGEFGYAGGTPTAPTAVSFNTKEYAYIALMRSLTPGAYPALVSGGTGGGGGGGGSSAFGGSGGGGAGVVWVSCFALVNNGTIRANGGNGGDGYTSSNTGGGGGGGGGCIVLIYNSKPTAGTIQASGGTGGTKYGTGTVGSNGSAGNIYELQAA
jgi:hypothetical protein